jgi:hypothetical protein
MLAILQKSVITAVKGDVVDDCVNDVFSVNFGERDYFVKLYSQTDKFKLRLRVINELMCSEIARLVVEANEERAQDIIIPEYGLVLDGDEVVGLYSNRIRFDPFMDVSSAYFFDKAIHSGIGVLHALRWCLADPDGNNVNTGLVRDPKTKQVQMVGIDWGLANYPGLFGQHALTEDEHYKVGCDAEEMVDDEQIQPRLEQAFDVSLDSVIGIDEETLTPKPGLFNEVQGENYQVLHSLFSNWDYAKLKDDQASQLKQDIFKTLNDFVRIASMVQLDIDVYTQNVRSARLAFRCVKRFINDRVKALRIVKDQVRRQGLHSPISVSEVGFASEAEQGDEQGAFMSYQSRLTMFSQAITRDDAVLTKAFIQKEVNDYLKQDL